MNWGLIIKVIVVGLFNISFKLMKFAVLAALGIFIFTFTFATIATAGSGPFRQNN